MSAFGPKRTSLVAPHMSAFRGKADMTIWASLFLRSLLGVKRTWVGALHMSAFDPERTSKKNASNAAFGGEGTFVHASRQCPVFAVVKEWIMKVVFKDEHEIIIGVARNGKVRRRIHRAYPLPAVRA